MYNLTVFVLLFVPIVGGARILGIVPFPCRSHAILGSTLLKELAARGHNVTMISSFPLQGTVKNYRDIYVERASRKVHAQIVKTKNNFQLMNSHLAMKISMSVGDALLSDKNVKALVASGEKFDLVINLGMDAILGLSHAVNATTIRFDVLAMDSFLAAYTKNPLASSYVPNFMSSFSEEMSFFERVHNTILNMFFELYSEYVWQHAENAIVQKHFPGAPHLRELQRDVQVSFVNSHMALENVRPHLSNVIQIGGFHLYTVQELPKDMKTFLDAASEGVILFSMGSNMRADVLRDKLNVMLKCFASLPYRILWKNDADVDGQPDNVKTMKWLPQQAILSHPNVKLFITHGGLGSIVEALHYAVPMIILPIYLDQHRNAAQGMRNGYAIQLDGDTLTEAKLRWAIMEMTTNPVRLNEIAVRSYALRHQEINPMEKAVFWVERALTHKSANYVKCIATQMPLHVYYLLDVYAFIILSLCTFIFISGVVVKRLFRCLTRSVQIKVKTL